MLCCFFFSLAAWCNFFSCLSPSATDSRGIMYFSHPSGCPSINTLSRDATSLYLVEGFQWNLPQIFIVRMDIAKIFKVRGQRSRSVLIIVCEMLSYSHSLEGTICCIQMGECCNNRGIYCDGAALRLTWCCLSSYIPSCNYCLWLWNEKIIIDLTECLCADIKTLFD